MVLSTREVRVKRATLRIVAGMLALALVQHFGIVGVALGTLIPNVLMNLHFTLSVESDRSPGEVVPRDGGRACGSGDGGDLLNSASFLLVRS